MVSGPHGNISAELAYNLLSGRAVRRPAIDGVSEDGSHWLTLKRLEVPDPYRFFVEQQLPDFDLEESINEIIPVQAMRMEEKLQVAEDLSKGNIVPVTDHRNERTIYLQADPARNEIQIVNNPSHPLKRAVESATYHNSKTRRGPCL